MSNPELTDFGWHTRFVNYLTADFRKKQAADPSFSLRAYAKKIGLSPAPVSEMINGKLGWSFSKTRAREIADSFNITKNQKNRLLSEMGLKLDRESRRLTDDEHALLGDYLQVILLASAELAPQFANVDSLAERFGLDVTTIHRALEPLVQRGVLKLGAGGILKPVTEVIEFSDGSPRPDVKKFHRVSLSKMLGAVLDIDVESRDVSTVLFVGSKQRLKFLREEIRKLQDRASSIMFDDDQEPDTLYQFSAQVCPVDSRIFESTGKV